MCFLFIFFVLFYLEKSCFAGRSDLMSFEVSTGNVLSALDDLELHYSNYIISSSIFLSALA